MECSPIVFVAFSFLLVGNAIGARKDPGENWKGHSRSGVLSAAAASGGENPDCHTTTTEAGEGSKGRAEELLKDFEQKVEKAFSEDFEPGPNVSVYHDDGQLGGVADQKSFMKDFEPGPDTTIYHDDEVASKEDKSFAKDFEPGPNVSVYHDDGKLGRVADQKSFMKDFEPGPDTTIYHDDEVASKEDKSFAKDFEPGPNVSVYHD